MGQIHAILLQLIAKGVIALKVKDPTKIRTPKILVSDLSVTTPNAKCVKRGMTLLSPAYLVDKYWDGINLCVEIDNDED